MRKESIDALLTSAGRKLSLLYITCWKQGKICSINLGETCVFVVVVFFFKKQALVDNVVIGWFSCCVIGM